MNRGGEGVNREGKGVNREGKGVNRGGEGVNRGEGANRGGERVWCTTRPQGKVAQPFWYSAGQGTATDL